MKQLTIFKSHYNSMESLVPKFSRDLLEKHRSPRIDQWRRLSLIFRKNQEYIVPDQIPIQHLNHLFVQLSFYVNSLQNKNASTASELFEVTQAVRMFQNELRMFVHDRSNKEAATSSLTQYVRETKNNELHDHTHNNEYLERINTILQNVLLRQYFLTNPSALLTVSQLAEVFQKKKSGSNFANANNQLFIKHSAHPLTETQLVRFFRFGRELSYERSLSNASNLLTELTKKTTSVDNRIITAQAVQRLTESQLFRLFHYGIANYDKMSNRKLVRNHIHTNEDKLITLQKLEHKISSSQTKQTNSLNSTQLFVEKQMVGILQNELGMDFMYRFPLMNPVFSQGTNIDHVVKETTRRVNSTLVGLPDQQQYISLAKRLFTELTEPFYSSQTKQTNSLNSTQLFVEKQMAGNLQNELGMDFKYRFPLMSPMFSKGTNIDHVVKETIRRVKSTLVGLPDQQQHISSTLVNFARRLFTELTEPFSSSQTKQTNSLNSTQLFVEKQMVGILQNELGMDFKYRFPLMNPVFSQSTNIDHVIKETIRRVKSTLVGLPDQQQHISLARRLFSGLTEPFSVSQTKQTNSLNSTQLFVEKQMAGILHNELMMDFKYWLPLMNPMFSQGTNIDHVVKETIRRVKSTPVGLLDQQKHISLVRRLFSGLTESFSFSQTKQTNSLNSTQLIVEKLKAGILQNELGMDFKYRFPLMNPGFSQSTYIDHVIKETIRRVKSTPVGLLDQQKHISLAKRRFTELTEQVSSSQAKQTNTLSSAQLFVEKQKAGTLQNEIQRDFKYQFPLMNPGFSINTNIHPIIKETDLTEQVSSSQTKQTNLFLHKKSGILHELKQSYRKADLAKRLLSARTMKVAYDPEQINGFVHNQENKKLVNKHLTILTNRFANMRMMSKPNKRSHLFEESVSYQTRNILNEKITQMPQISPHTKTYKLPVSENILGSMTWVNHLNRDIHRRASVILQTTTDLSEKLKDKNKPAIIDQNMEPKFEPQTLHYVKLTKQPEREMLSSSQQDVTMQYAKSKPVHHDIADQKTDKTLANTQTETKIAAPQTINEQIQSTYIDKIVDKVFREFERKLRMESNRRGY